MKNDPSADRRPVLSVRHRWRARAIPLTLGAVLVLILAGVVTVAAVSWWRERNVGPVERGRAAAEARGCFSCHGPAGMVGFEGERDVGAVPSFGPDDVTEYAKSEAEIREWILEGRLRRLDLEDPAGSGQATGQSQRHPGAPPEAGGKPASPTETPIFRMPAWRGVLSDRELDDIVAYIKAVSEFETPTDPQAEEGRQVAGSLGCFRCHGPQGRGNTPNPGSFKGYIPSWDGPDFPELAADDAEIREWILDGGTERLRRHPIASWFLGRQVIAMPAFRGRVTEAELEQLLAYIKWLRRSQDAGGR